MLSVNLADSGTYVFAGTLTNGAGGLGLAISGLGTQVLTGTNSYSGGTVVSGGTLGG